MAIMRWDPFKDMLSLQERMNRLFDESFGRFSKGVPEAAAVGTWAPTVDVFETKDAIVVKADLPGVNKDSIKIEIKDNIMLLHGERKEEKEVKEENYYRFERVFGRFERSFGLPATVDKSKVKAKYKDGVLEISIPKAEEVKPKEVAIEIE